MSAEPPRCSPAPPSTLTHWSLYQPATSPLHESKHTHAPPQSCVVGPWLGFCPPGCRERAFGVCASTVYKQHSCKADVPEVREFPEQDSSGWWIDLAGLHSALSFIYGQVPSTFSHTSEYAKISLLLLHVNRTSARTLPAWTHKPSAHTPLRASLSKYSGQLGLTCPKQTPDNNRRWPCYLLTGEMANLWGLVQSMNTKFSLSLHPATTVGSIRSPSSILIPTVKCSGDSQTHPRRPPLTPASSNIAP